MIECSTTKSMVARAEALMLVIGMVAMKATAGVMSHDDGDGAGGSCGSDGRWYL